MSKTALIAKTVAHDPVFWKSLDEIHPLEREEPTEWKPQAWVYFLLDVEASQVKIGFTSRSVASRIANHEQRRGRKLDLLGTLQGERNLERTLHNRFRPYLREREWYSAEILPEVAELLS